MKTGDRESGTAATRLGNALTRRGMIAGLASLAAAPKQSSAQQAPAKIPRVGWIWSGRSAGNPTEVAGFRQGLQDLGYIEGQNIVVDYRFGEGDVDRATELAAELVHRRPNILVVFGDVMVRDVERLTTTIPV